MTVDTLRHQAANLISEIKTLPDIEQRNTLLREIRAKCAGSIISDLTTSVSKSNMHTMQEARKANGVSDETRAKLSERTKASWAKRKQQADVAAD